MDEVERMVVGVRADTAGFAREVEAMRATMEGSLGAGAERAGRAIESALLRSVRAGKFGFEDLKGVALGVLAEVARAAVRSGVGAVTGGSSLGGVLAGLVGLPGRATGGPVSPGRGYVVGERGPEVFVPTSSGRVEAGGSGGRDVRVSITVQAGAGEAPAALQRSGRQVARAVRAALEG
ncbi:tail tape measure protein [Sphingomonadaceae bacterium OTU29MARTA1]|uniref:tail tape measure protein n=1 Tax=Sphingomonas sp. Leaf37 TaxID=2876552 RepID=UPI001E4F69B0|nr:tail tape measure protein [Sphingomonas sp. Leaf37]USU03494.1 tail tape measure protein [Sphingomonadaceae bacterium OTU29LAMAA1]USU10343.1 tail tape measure protein [Sphingomonadaceae bacterium OTU29MARTA1]